MKLQEAINNRASIRAYEKKQVPKKLLIKLIENAAKAPSAANWQPYEFYVVCDKKIRDKIANLSSEPQKKKKKEWNKFSPKLKEIVAEFYLNLGNCPCIILVYSDKEKNKEYKHSKILSVAAAVENLILSATDNGLGTCWFASIKNIPGVEKKINSMLNIKNKELITAILVGYPKKGYKPLKRKKKELKEILKFV